MRPIASAGKLVHAAKNVAVWATGLDDIVDGFKLMRSSAPRLHKVAGVFGLFCDLGTRYGGHALVGMSIANGRHAMEPQNRYSTFYYSEYLSLSYSALSLLNAMGAVYFYTVSSLAIRPQVEKLIPALRNIRESPSSQTNASA